MLQTIYYEVPIWASVTLGPTFLACCLWGSQGHHFREIERSKASSLRIGYTYDKYSEHQTLNCNWQAPLPDPRFWPRCPLTGTRIINDIMCQKQLASNQPWNFEFVAMETTFISKTWWLHMLPLGLTRSSFSWDWTKQSFISPDWVYLWQSIVSTKP